MSNPMFYKFNVFMTNAHVTHTKGNICKYFWFTVGNFAKLLVMWPMIGFIIGYSLNRFSEMLSIFGIVMMTMLFFCILIALVSYCIKKYLGSKIHNIIAKTIEYMYIIAAILVFSSVYSVHIHGVLLEKYEMNSYLLSIILGVLCLLCNIIIVLLTAGIIIAMIYFSIEKLREFTANDTYVKKPVKKDNIITQYYKSIKEKTCFLIHFEK